MKHIWTGCAKPHIVFDGRNFWRVSPGTYCEGEICEMWTLLLTIESLEP